MGVVPGVLQHLVGGFQVGPQGLGLAAGQAGAGGLSEALRGWEWGWGHSSGPLLSPQTRAP